MHLPCYGMGSATRKPAARDTDEARRMDITNTYDYLGPLSRQAIAESPIDVHIGRMLASAPLSCISDDGLGWDDVRLSRWINATQAAKVHMKPQDFMLVPRRVMHRVGEAGGFHGPHLRDGWDLR